MIGCVDAQDPRKDVELPAEHGVESHAGQREPTGPAARGKDSATKGKTDGALQRVCAA